MVTETDRLLSIIKKKTVAEKSKKWAAEEEKEKLSRSALRRFAKKTKSSVKTFKKELDEPIFKGKLGRAETKLKKRVEKIASKSYAGAKSGYASLRAAAGRLEKSSNSRAKERAYNLKVMKLQHQQRMQLLQQQQQQADPRFQNDFNDFPPVQYPNQQAGFEPTPDLNAYQEQIQKRNYGQDFVRGLSNLSKRFTQPRQPQQDMRGAPIELRRQMIRQQNILNTPATILQTPNIFNKPTNTIQTNGISLMSQPPPASKLNWWRAP